MKVQDPNSRLRKHPISGFAVTTRGIPAFVHPCVSLPGPNTRDDHVRLLIFTPGLWKTVKTSKPGMLNFHKTLQNRVLPQTQCIGLSDSVLASQTVVLASQTVVLALRTVVLALRHCTGPVPVPVPLYPVPAPPYLVPATHPTTWVPTTMPGTTVLVVSMPAPHVSASVRSSPGFFWFEHHRGFCCFRHRYWHTGFGTRETGFETCLVLLQGTP